jgi:hypothetical protein
MKQTERDLSNLLGSIQPILRPETYVFFNTRREESVSSAPPHPFTSCFADAVAGGCGLPPFGEPPAT